MRHNRLSGTQHPHSLLLPSPLPSCLALQAAVDVVLGDSAVLSRQHCRIAYNFQLKKWQLLVEVRGLWWVGGLGAAHQPAVMGIHVSSTARVDNVSRQLCCSTHRARWQDAGMQQPSQLGVLG